MTLPVLFSRRAERALVEIHARYSSVSLPLGEAFLAETDRLAVLISRTPRVFPSLPHRPPVVHARRDPRAWPVREIRSVYQETKEAA